MTNKNKKILLISIIFIFLVIILKLSLSFLYYKGIIFPSYAVFKEKVINVDDYKSIISNSDDFDDKEFNKPLRKIILKNKKIYAYSDKDYLIWETPDEYKIQDFYGAI